MLKRMRLVGACALVGLTAVAGCSSDSKDEDPFTGSTSTSGSTSATGSGDSSGSTTGNSGDSGSDSGSSGDSGSTSGSSGTSVTSGSSTTGASGSGSGSGSSGSGTSGGSNPSASACDGLEVTEEQDACVGVGYEAEPVAIDMYIMVDYTSSMDNSDELTGGLSRWDLTVEAIKDFVNSPGAEDIRVALQFFSYVQTSDCNVDKYATPAVDMGFAPDVANDIEDALDAQSPIGLTPTYPALQGAIEFAKGWQQDEGLGRQTVVVFVTDGYPTECDPQDISLVADLAEQSFTEEPRVPVYVIGLDGTLNLNQIAQQGGTREAFDITSGGTTDEFVQALSNITNSEVTCEFEIPDPPENMGINYDEVQVIYDPANGAAMEVPFSPSGYNGCGDNGGWYFGGADANGDYTKILTCPCTCASFQAGQVEVRLGCSPQQTIN